MSAFKTDRRGNIHNFTLNFCLSGPLHSPFSVLHDAVGDWHLVEKLMSFQGLVICSDRIGNKIAR